MSEKRGCLYLLCKCFSKPKTTPKEPNRPSDIINDRIIRLNSQLFVKTIFSKENILASNDYNNESTKFNCPICFRYYNHILQFDCCNNYICLSCVEEYKSAYIKYENKIKCPFCQKDKVLTLSDVDVNLPGRIYLDSSFDAVKC
jgi:hypothetical protein